MREMQTKGVIHRDIKNANILITIPPKTKGLQSIDAVFNSIRSVQIV